MELNIKYTVNIKYSYEIENCDGWHKHICNVPVSIKDFDAFLHEELAGLKKLAEQPLKDTFNPRNGTFRNIQVVSFYITAESDVVRLDPTLVIVE